MQSYRQSHAPTSPLVSVKLLWRIPIALAITVFLGACGDVSDVAFEQETSAAQSALSFSANDAPKCDERREECKTTDPTLTIRKKSDVYYSAGIGRKLTKVPDNDAANQTCPEGGTGYLATQYCDDPTDPSSCEAPEWCCDCPCSCSD